MVCETHMPEFYLVFETCDVSRLGRLFDRVLRLQDLVDTLHRGQTLGDAVACLREVLQGVDDGIEHHHVVDEDRPREGVVVQHEHAAEPQHDHDHDGAQELAHGVGEHLSRQHPHQVRAVGRVHVVEAAVHLLLGDEGLDDAQSPQRLLHLAHRVAPQGLGLDGVLLQFTAHEAHEPSHDGDDGQREECQLPGYEEQGGEVTDDEDGVLEHHLQAGHDGVLHLVYVAAHAGDDVTLALLAEEAHGQRRDLAVELVAHVAHHACPDGQDAYRCQVVDARLQEGGGSQEQADQQQRRRLAPFGDEAVHVVVHVVHQHLLHVTPVPCHQAGGSLCVARLEQDLQDGYQGCEGEDVQHCRQDIEHHRQHQVFLVWRHEPPQYAKEFFHILFILRILGF